MLPSTITLTPEKKETIIKRNREILIDILCNQEVKDELEFFLSRKQKFAEERLSEFLNGSPILSEKKRIHFLNFLYF